MTVQADSKRADAFYGEFYRDGGWKYSFWKEYWWHRRHVVKRFGLRRGMRILEVACGTGFHTNLLNRMGFQCVGVDRSLVGIEWARKHYPRWAFHCSDITGEMPVEPGSFDAVLARGCSHYHYDLASGQALSTTTHLMRYLKPGGMFIMVIVTDLSGKREPGKVWQNTLEEYQRHFSSFGRRWSVDWVRGMAICGLHNEPLDRLKSPSPASELQPGMVTGIRPAAVGV
jgi:SAM-dependent methyltransferase